MKQLMVAAAIIAAHSLPAAAQSQPGKIYLQLDGGASFLGEADLNGGDADYEAGYSLGGRLGSYFAPNARIELDVAYSNNEFDQFDDIDLSSAALDADLSVITFGVGMYGDLFRSGAIAPYLGVGAGGAYKEQDTNFGEDEKATNFTAHVEGGISFDLTPNIAVVPHYRFLWLDNAGDDELYAHWVRLGLRFNQ